MPDFPPDFSIVIPVYNEESNIAELYRRVSTVMDEVEGEWELLLVDDGSRDRTLSLLRELHARDRRVVYLSFARNFGHQIAVTAGLNFAKGRAVIVMDADLQDPPEIIPQTIDRWREGYLVVYAVRSKRLQESWFKKFSAYIFYRLLDRLADISIPTDTGDFCLMDRQVVDILNRMPERDRYIRGLRSWVGFRQTSVTFDRDARYSGEVKYTLAKSFSLAVGGLLSFSKVPLRLATYLGLFSAFMAMIMVILVIYWRFFIPRSPLTGLATIAIAIFFLGAVQLVCIGILGEYIGRIYEQVKGRPLYTIAELGLDAIED
jgi:dolichol-phosphate mannosyltransferase